MIRPLDKSIPVFLMTRFLSYSFESSVLIPVSTFNFSFAHPAVSGSILDSINEGDIAVLTSDSGDIATGIIDMIQIETTADGGEVVHLSGRDLLEQLEDQTSISVTDDPIWGGSMTVTQALQILLKNTRIPGIWLQGAPAGNWLFATMPGETKLASIQRLLEPLNCIIWSDPSGNITVGRPNMGQAPLGTITMDRINREANCLSIKSTQSSTQIPNIVVPIWSGQETTVSRTSKDQRINNPAEGPQRLRRFGHLVPKAIVASLPTGGDPQSQSDINQVTISAGASTLLQAIALREMARANIHEKIVEVNMPGHFNDNLKPFLVDQVYSINYPRAKVQEKMYLFQVNYTGDLSTGSRTSLMFCRLGRIVAYINSEIPRRTFVSQAGQ